MATTSSRCRIRRRTSDDRRHRARDRDRAAPSTLRRRLTADRSAVLPRTFPLRHAETDVVDAGRRDRQRSGAHRRRRQRLPTCSAITPTPRPRPGSSPSPDGALGTGAAPRPTGSSTTSTIAGARPSTSRRPASTSFFAGPATDAGTPTPATRRERQIEGGRHLPDPPRRGSSTRRGCRSSAPMADYTLGRQHASRATARRCARRGRRSRRAPTATRSAARTASPPAPPRSSSAAASDRSPTRPP